MQGEKRDLLQDCAWGVSYTIKVALFGGASYLVGRKVNGSAPLGDVGTGPFALFPLVLVLLVGTMLSGIALGLMRPLLKMRRGFVMTVVVVEFFALEMFWVARYGAVYSWQGIAISAFVALIAGTPGAALWWMYRRWRMRASTA